MIPSTPSKGNDEINSITTSLAARWSLQFPVRDATYSPSKVKDPTRTEEQVMIRLRYLVFKDHQGLTDALDRFEKHAETIFSRWKYKPRADQDVLPRRSHAESSLQRDTFLRRSEVTEATAGDLMKSLLHNLELASDHAKKTQNPISKVDDATSIVKLEEPCTTNAKSTSPLTTQSPRDRLLTPNTVLQPGRHVELSHVAPRQPPSDEFDSDVEVSGIMADVLMTESPVLGSKNSLEAKESSAQDEEIFTTPPTSPPHSNEASSDAFFLQRPDPVPLPQMPPLSKKRSYEESMKPPLARRITRTRHENQNSVHEERRTTPAELHPSNSFDSATSSGTFGMTTSSTSWTPSTSFFTNSITTSFNSSIDTTDKPDIFMHDRPSQTIRPEAKKMEVERFLDVNDDVREYESMDIDSDTVLLERTHRADLSRTKSLSANPIEYGTLSGRKEEEYLAEQFVSSNLLTPLDSQKRSAVSFRQLYEVTRVSMATNLPLEVFSTCLNEAHEVYDELWTLLRSIAKAHGTSLPERSSLTAWDKATTNYDGVSLTGELQYAEQPGGPIFDFSLKPMKVEKSYRLARRFGGDRFCVIGMPGLSSENLPGYLKPNHSAVRESIIKRLVDTEFCFLGRLWRAFYLKPDRKKPRGRKQNSSNETKFRIYFFAQDGHGFGNQPLTGEADPRRNFHSPMSIANLIDWFMPAEQNRNQNCLKFFTRLALGLSNTTPTVEFYPHEIIWTHDAHADNPEVRRVNPKPEAGKSPKDSKSESPIMNDGCARISKAAALAITDMLRLDQSPYVFQGRIAGAKGVWMVDILDESVPGCTRDFWIEVTPSQLKFKGHKMDNYYADADRMTFEVHSYSKKLSATNLKFPLMPILANRGVPEEVFSRLLKEDLTDKVDVLRVAMDGGLALGKWNQDTNPVTGERAFCKEIKMQGGVPDSTPERIHWFIEHGFEPKHCRELKDVLFKAILEYCLRLENKMNIGIGKSTSALMIADPLAILEPNDIQLCFSSTFRDPKSRWEDFMLNDIDVLVARLPASLPSDIQKVRAVFKLELRRYTDVVIFSSKGSCSLAHKLSGGDYDGDRAWICWEPSIVDPFQNASVPEPPSSEDYGIEKDEVKVSDLLPLPDFTSAFLLHAFSFNLQPDLLGLCTMYHESLCYSGTAIDDPKAVCIGALLGQLVDRAKAGIIFDEDKWTKLLKKLGLPTWHPKPAYKNKEKARPRDHLIDNLVFRDAKGVREKALGEFNRHFAQVASWDEDLVRIYNSETELAKNDKVLANVLDDLKAKLNKITDYWMRNVRVIDDDEFQYTRKPNSPPFPAVVERCRADFLSIKPCSAPGVDNFHVVERWNRESGSGSFGAKYWSWLKASVFFQHRDNHRRRLVWYVAGVELAEMKAMARGTGTYRVVKREVHHAMKLNAKLVDEFKRDSILEAEEAEEAEDHEEDEYGGWAWDE
ncbi:hypothetical protein MMC22_002190 [Lobaria immixta]|nr:hypothetical protein [Lobaria immixta]